MQTLEISFLQIFYILWHERQRRQPAASSDCNVQNNCRMEKTHEPSGKLSLFTFEKLHENMGLERGGSILTIVACRKKIRQKQLSERMHVKRSEVPVKSLRLTRFNGVNFTTWTLFFFCLKKSSCQNHQQISLSVKTFSCSHAVGFKFKVQAQLRADLHKPTTMATLSLLLCWFAFNFMLVSRIPPELVFVNFQNPHKGSRKTTNQTRVRQTD